ncbi:MAG: PTS IIA-like nitrogen regulatory protein PtsN [Alphaproteobacteria bacterium]|nr:PTS IIA-like nitrogen regulatory protein PtsN [Alphaproteobacteria bacterium]
MKISDILAPDAVLHNVKAKSKKQLLGELAKLAAKKTGLNEAVVLDALIERERLGTTGIGMGVALPHTRLPKLKKIFCGFASSEPVDFDAVDNKPVDLAFVLLVPEEAGADHLKALARLSRLLRNEETVNSLRKAESAKALYKLVIENDTNE